MSATPQFGGSNGVTELDAGQPGSGRATSNDARYVVRVIEGADQATVVGQAIVQQNVTFEDRLGYAGTRVVWEGSLRVSSDTVLGAIQEQLNKYLHGSGRSSGVLGGPDPAQMRPTKLTNNFGRVLSERAVVEEWSMNGVGTLFNASPYTLIVEKLRIVFKLLG